MKISLNWIRDYIDVDLSIPRLIEVLNNIGLLVDSWEEKDGDVVLDLETYANRPDTLGHLGVARELAAILDLPLKEPNWPLTELGEKASDIVDVQVWEEDLCPRYCGMVVRDIEIGPSPDWLRKRIEAMGLKPINNVVDVTNYVLFATAHPIHAFDLAKISGQKVIVRRANKGEILKDLERREITLSPENLVIADEKKPIALAGIIGGEESAVSGTTQAVFIESAYFDPVTVRRASKETGIQTDASYRFERGADISFPPQAALMAASLWTQFKGKVAKGVADVYPKPRKKRTMMLRQHRITGLLGMEIEPGFVTRVFTRLGFQVEDKRKGIWQAKVPSFRVDIEREADLIEEVARFYGYDRIPSSLPSLEVGEVDKDQKRRSIRKMCEALFHQGFDEVINFSFFDPEKKTQLNTGLEEIKIRNPISSKASLLRTTLIGGLLDNVSWNKNRGAEGVHIFEVGNIYYWENEAPREVLTLALATTGLIGSTPWQAKRETADFYYLKGACEALMNKLRYEPFFFRQEELPFFETGHSLCLEYKGAKIGYLGLIKKEVQDAYSLEDLVWASELNLLELLEKKPRSFEFVPVAKFPPVSRDLTFLASQKVSYQTIEEAVRKLPLHYLERFHLYDRFSGPSIPKDRVSLSFRFIFRHPQRTLHSDEVDQFIQKIISTLHANLNLTLKEGG